jgi:uncharacterized LabA/DUF88 family protein
MNRPLNNYAFIDGNNLYRGIRNLGWRIDYVKFRTFLEQKFGVKRAYMFMGFVPGNEAMYRDFQEWGYVLIFKPTFTDQKGIVKGNCDAELVLQAMIDLQEYAKAVIVTGDGDFQCLVNHLEKIGKLEHVICPDVRKASWLLRKAVPEKIMFLDRYASRLKHNPS